MWDLTAVGQPYRKKKDQQSVISAVQAIGRMGEVRKKPWQVVDDPSVAVDIIGLDLKIHGIEWLEKHPQEKQFLAASGITPERAIEMHDEWRRATFKRFGRDEKGREISNGNSINGKV